ncbi:hypothetical protein [Okeania sp. SIO1I7]|uniref:hypothetical protein n=1 Tax=Okeania sp. SIO1I7 TaxID=2607772 RepID=UPI0025E30F25|nr:hypothetical protein [Okeania sp. SIO1I7]
MNPDIPPEQQANYLADISTLGAAGVMGIAWGNPIPVIIGLNTEEVCNYQKLFLLRILESKSRFR